MGTSHLAALAAAMAMLSGTITAIAAGDVRVAVVDRADGKPLSAATVRIIRSERVIREGITGSDGTLSFENVPAGNAVVECERVGYVRKPETRGIVIGEQRSVTVRLLSTQRD